MKARLIVSACAAVALVGAASAPALAHHSFAMFDFQASKTVTGTVEQFDWTNPHTFIWLQVPTANGASERYGFEGMSPNYLGRRGWTKNTLKPGDKVTVTFHPMKDSSQKGGTYQKVMLSDGKELQNIG